MTLINFLLNKRYASQWTWSFRTIDFYFQPKDSESSASTVRRALLRINIRRVPRFSIMRCAIAKKDITGLLSLGLTRRFSVRRVRYLYLFFFFNITLELRACWNNSWSKLSSRSFFSHEPIIVFHVEMRTRILAFANDVSNCRGY